MKSSTKNKVEGTFHQVKGQIKESIGKITNDYKLEAKGIGEKLAGKSQEKIGKAEKVLGK